MPTTQYRLEDGTRVPGVTTIIGLLAKPALIPWAYKRGKEGLDLYDSRDKAAEIGTIAHEMIEQLIKGEPWERPEGLTDEIVTTAWNCLDSFNEWADLHKLNLTKHEEHLVSEEHAFGGTPDHWGEIGGKWSMLDLKTSNTGPYPEWIVQLAAYSQLCSENGEPPFERIHLLRVGKEDGSFHHHSWGPATIKRGWEAFKHLRGLHTEMNALKKAC